MAFTKALYYPSIDIRNEGWLKNAILYWDQIQTIVPESIQNPYTSETAIELLDLRILSPISVHSNMPQIRGIKDDVLEYLHTPEGIESIILTEGSNINYLHKEKLFHELEDIMYSLDRGRLDLFENEWIAVPDKFSKFYMTLLATRLSEEYGLGLLTESASSNKLANAARLDANLFETRIHMNDRFSGRDDYFRDIERLNRIRYQDRVPRNLAEGTLVDLIFKDLQIDSATPLYKILEFRDEHKYELGNFRRKLGSLTQAIPDNKSMNAFNQRVEDIYNDEILTEISLLKEGLKRMRIRRGVENFMKVSLLSTTASGLLFMLGLSAPYILLATSAISIVGAGILYNTEKRDLLDNNPFSYLLSLEKSFTN